MTVQAARYTGGCTCRYVRYEVAALPIFVHCCHCTWCQRETGAAFALNALVEASAVSVTHGDIDLIDTPSLSGRGQKIARCPQCRVAVWSNYYQAGPGIRFIRVGTLDEPGAFPPDVHIYTSTKQPWVVIPPGARSFAEFYNPKQEWSGDSMQRFLTARSSV